MNDNEWVVKLDPRYESNIKGYSKEILREIEDVVNGLKIDPYIGKNLGPQRPWLWEVYVGSPARFRLYYEIWERKKIIYLKAFYPKNLQRRFLRGKI